MSEIRLQIDGREVRAEEGMTILEAARAAGVSIPTLCHHDKLQPYGGCRLCIVEAEADGRSNIVASCVHRVEDDLIVRTRSEKIDRIRKTLLELLLAHAPDSPVLQEMAREYGADRNRFEQEASFCIQQGDQLPPGDRLRGVQRLQGVFPTLPDVISAGRLRPGRGPLVPRLNRSHRRPRTAGCLRRMPLEVG